MGDVAEILGLGGNRKQDGLSVEASKILGIDKKNAVQGVSKGAKKPKGMSREVFGLLGQDGLTSSMQSQPVTQNSLQMFKSKRTTSANGKWFWSPVFISSSTPTFTPNQPMKNHPRIFHWLKSDLAYSEYPYLKFNVQLDRITFTDDEYEQLLKNNRWTRSESEYLLDLCFTYELRWPVITDRYTLLPARRTEELQDRFYFMIGKLQAHRRGASNDGDTHSSHFNIDIEKTRRIQQELMFHKTKQESAEEIVLKDELKFVDGAVKKSKKTSRPSERGQSSSGGGVEIATDVQILSMVGKPALQSSRMLPPELTTIVSKTLSKKLSVLLKDLGLPDKMLPTKTVCDMYDQVRRDGTALMSLQNIITRRERDIAALKSGSPLDEYSDMKLPSSLLTTKFPPVSSKPFASVALGTGSSGPNNQSSSATGSSGISAGNGLSSNAATSVASGSLDNNALPPVPKKATKRKKSVEVEAPAKSDEGQGSAGALPSTKKIKREK